MKICFFNLTETSDAKVANGVVRVAMILACALRSRGNEVVFYTPPPKRDLKQFELSAGAHFSGVPADEKIFREGLRGAESGSVPAG